MILPDPMLASEGLSPLDRPGWWYEVKFDGWRLVAGVVAGKVHIRSRRGADYTSTFPEVVTALAALGDGPHILDGEGVVFDEDTGRSDFDRLQDRALRRRAPRPGDDAVVFMVFDALMINGVAMTDKPFEVRKAALRDLIADNLAAVQYVEHYAAQHGRDLYRQAIKLKLEGLVAKRAASLYHPGERSADWKKVKVPGAVPPERFKR